MDVRWAVTQYPTEAAAQTVGMTVTELTEFVFGACLRDWDAERAAHAAVRRPLDAADEIRIVGADTDLRLSVAGRHAEVDHGLRNMPGGEVFLCPLEDSAEGVITYGEVTTASSARRWKAPGSCSATAPSSRRSAARGRGRAAAGARHRRGRAAARRARHRLQPRHHARDAATCSSTRRSTAPSTSRSAARYTSSAARNDSAIHWDIVKDLRGGGELWADGELVQRDGAWLI